MRRYRLDETALRELAEYIAKALQPLAATVEDIEKMLASYLREES